MQIFTALYVHFEEVILEGTIMINQSQPTERLEKVVKPKAAQKQHYPSKVLWDKRIWQTYLC